MARDITLMRGFESARELGARAVTPDMPPGNVLSMVRAYRDACLDEGEVLEPVPGSLARTA